MTRTWP